MTNDEMTNDQSTIYQSTNYQRTDNLPQNGAGATRFYLILTQRHKEHKEKTSLSLCLCVRNIKNLCAFVSLCEK